MDRTQTIFGNPMSPGTRRKAERAKRRYIRRFGDDSGCCYGYALEENPILGPALGVVNVRVCADGPGGEALDRDKGVLIGNIRMGFGHYRISMAMASAARALGYTPYWFDLHAYTDTTGGQIIAHLNRLYSLGSRLSQKFPLFNILLWEPISAQGFRKLSYNAVDQKVSELMAAVCQNLPADMPFVATHVWPAQAAVHAGMTRVVNAIPDNWPMALHLAEGAVHTVQTPSAFLGYKTLKGMAGSKVLKPIPAGQLVETGHYVDHELLENLDADSARRLARLESQEPLRILLTVGGAGAQAELYAAILKHLLPRVREGRVALFINVGDHRDVWDFLSRSVPGLADGASLHFDDWDETREIAARALDGDVRGVHAFYHEDIFAAVYSTNLLMRAADLMVTKPSELAFYPVPKLLVQRIGGHEAWGAIRAAELGDGTLECDTQGRTLQMLDLLLSEPELLVSMNRHILTARAAGVYDGAYKAVQLAADKK
jgi:UDP-N-acetylglucosamine:LPS N-acetylglucosamine transferase